jgi:hypothetical protein
MPAVTYPLVPSTLEIGYQAGDDPTLGSIDVSGTTGIRVFGSTILIPNFNVPPSEKIHME